jgi:predicted Rossmann fold flavoprotein
LSYDYNLLVIGGGAAGFFSALSAAESAPSMKIGLLEKSGKLLSKVRISGGGRCNVTNAQEQIKIFSKSYPRGEKFMYKLLHQFNQRNTIEWFMERGVKLHAEPDGRMFPISNDSSSIVDCLMNEAEKAKIQIQLHSGLQSFEVVENGFVVHTSTGSISTQFLLLATGGHQHAKDYQWIKEKGINITEPVPSLFTFNVPNHPMKDLMGVATDVRIKIDKTKLQETGPLLVTHWGFSGPAVLRCSAWGARTLAEQQYNFQPRINWLPDLNQEEVADFLLQQKEYSGKRKTIQRVFDGIPQRLWEYLLVRADIDPESIWMDQKNATIRRLAEIITSDPYTVSGKTTFKEEFVTSGGVSLDEIDAQTCMSKSIKGLFFAGEVLDSDGITGGFNFQQAWSSGWIAGKSIAKQFNTLKYSS